MDEKLFHYLNIDAAYQPKRIPGQNKFTFMSRKSGLPQVWTLNENDEPIQYSNLDDSVMNVYHSPNGEMSVVSKSNNGCEKQQFYLISENGAKTEPLVESPEHFHHFGGWSPDSKTIVYSSNRRGPGFFDLFLFDIETRVAKRIFECNDICRPLLWLRDGKHLLINIPVHSNDQNIFKLNIETSELSKFGANKSARYQSFNLTRDGEGGYVLTDLHEDTLYIGKFTFDKPDQFEKIVHSSEWDIREIRLSPDGQKLAYTLNVEGFYQLFIFDLETNQKRQIDNVPKGVIDSISWLDSDQFIYAVNTPTCPGDIWKYTLTSNQIERLTNLSSTGDVELTFIEPQLCHFESFDGLKVPYFYYEKNKGRNKPAILYIHGGPANQTRADFNPLFQYLAEQGYAVVAPNVRGSIGYGRTYESLDDVRKRMDPVKDLVWLVKDLVEVHKINPDQVGIMGRSYGGFMVLAATSHYPELWAAAVNIVGMSSLKTFVESMGEWRRKLRSAEYGTLEDDAEFFEEISPLNHSHKIKAPLLVFHGLNDTRVPVNESTQIVMAMKERQQDVELTIFNDEGHISEKKKNQIDMNRSIISFFNEKLLLENQL